MPPTTTYFAPCAFSDLQTSRKSDCSGGRGGSVGGVVSMLRIRQSWRSGIPLAEIRYGHMKVPVQVAVRIHSEETTRTYEYESLASTRPRRRIGFFQASG